MYSHFIMLLSLGSMAQTAQTVLASAADYGTKSGKAVYMMTNGEANAVVALPIDKRGMLQAVAGTVTKTSGAGQSGINPVTGEPFFPDSLASQSSLAIAGERLFVVNAGSNTLSMFRIDSNDPTKLTLLGKPVAVPGEFPNTVGVSSRNKIACVGTSGAKAGVSCASFSSYGLGTMDDLRKFDIRQTTPPSAPFGTVSQVFFSEDESTMYSTIKGDPFRNVTGFFASFTVQRSAGKANVAREGTMSFPASTAVLFGASNIPRTKHIFVTDPSFGAAILGVGESGIAKTVASQAINGQNATCWVAISPATGTAFVADGAVNRLVEMSLKDASIQSETNLTDNAAPGLYDIAAAGKFVYALNPGNGSIQAAAVVVDVVNKVQVQYVPLNRFGLDRFSQGMALLKHEANQY